MKMSLSKIRKKGKTLIRVNIREYENDDIAILDQLGVTNIETDMSAYRYAICSNPTELDAVRGGVFDKYDVVADNGKVATLRKK